MRNNVRIFLTCLMSLPKTIWVNCLYLPFWQAIKMPILVGWNVSLRISGGIIIDSTEIKPGMIKVGISDGSFGSGKNGHSMLQLQKNSSLTFKGKTNICNHFVINNAGKIVFGENFSSNFGLLITCSSRIEFGNDCLLGWNNTFIDNDGHRITNLAGTTTSSAKPIIVGNHNWITSENAFMKGSGIGDNCVVGYQSFIQTNFSTKNHVLLAGKPAKIIKMGINWEK